MEIHVNVDEVLDTRNLEQMQRILETSDPDEFQDKMEKLAKAGLYELSRMVMGESLPTRAVDIQQNRLLHLIMYFFDGNLPKEEEISRIFHITYSQARTLLLNVRSRFILELEGAEKKAVEYVVNEAEAKDQSEPASDYTVVIRSPNVIQLVNDVLGREKPFLDRIQPIGNCGYEISADAMKTLKEFLTK